MNQDCDCCKTSTLSKKSNDNETEFLIISFSGGGVRGLIQLEFLNEMYKCFGASVLEKCRMFTGSSIGGILALCLAKHYSVTDLYKIFNNDFFKQVCQKSWLDRLLGRFQCDPLYDGRVKKRALESLFNDTCTLSSVTLKNSKLVFIPAYNLHSQSMEFFHNFNNGGGDVKLSQIANATSAAPTVFPSVAIENLCCCMKNGKNGKGKSLEVVEHCKCKCNKDQVEDQYFIDGGVLMNNPSLAAVLAVENYLQNVKVQVKVLSIGTGTCPLDPLGKETRNFGGVEWAVKGGLANILLNNESVTEQMMRLKMKNDAIYLYVTSNNVPKELRDIDNTTDENLNALRSLGKQMFYSYKDRLADFFNVEKKYDNS
jgi:uncharacterized protein